MTRKQLTEKEYILAGNYQFLDALYARLNRAESEAKGYEANWRLALAERDKERELSAGAGVYLNKVLGQRNDLAAKLRALVETIGAHEIESLQCDGKEAEHCDCLHKRTVEARTALAALNE